MILTNSMLIAAHLLLSPLHNIDFQISPDQQSPTANARDSGRPSTPRDLDGVVSKTRYSIARGFGNQVPVAFAAKQIVPPPFKIEVEKGIDPAITVSWIGGRPWNEVLWLTLHSQSLHMTVLRNVVFIRR